MSETGKYAKKEGVVKKKHRLQPEEVRVWKSKIGKKNGVKKADHKHLYQLIPMGEKSSWFTHKEICSICGRIS